MDGSVVFKQMALRTSAIFLVKLLGLLARIPLFRLLGPEGIGLYQMGYSVYGLILTLLTGGFPTALAIATSKDRQQGWRLFERISLILLPLSSVAAGIMVYLSKEIAALFGDPDLNFVIRCLAPAIVIVPILTLLRGFLQGIERYGTIAVSELVEQVVRTGVMVFLAFVWIRYGVDKAVGGASLGAFAGALIALLFLAVIFWRNLSKSHSRLFRLGKPTGLDSATLLFFNTSFAIAGTRILLPISDFLDALIVPHRLQDAGMSISAATSLYGEVSGMAITVVYIPTIITAALNHTLTAKLSVDWQEQRMKRFNNRLHISLTVAWLWGIGSGLFLFFYSVEVSTLVFGTDTVAKAIQLLSMGPLMGGLRDITNSILWVVGRRKEPFVGLVLGMILSVLCNIYLVAIPGMAYVGITIGLLITDITSVLLNLTVLVRSKLKIPFISILAECIAFATTLYFIFSFLQISFQHVSLSDTSVKLIKMGISCGIIFLYLASRFLKRTTKKHL